MTVTTTSLLIKFAGDLNLNFLLSEWLRHPLFLSEENIVSLIVNISFNGICVERDAELAEHLRNQCQFHFFRRLDMPLLEGFNGL